MVTTMYSKKIHIKKETTDQSIKENSPISKELIDKLRGLYNVREYNDATSRLFGDSDIRVTKLTVFQANMLIIHSKLLKTPVKKKRGKDITPKKKNINPYINIWNTLEK